MSQTKDIGDPIVRRYEEAREIIFGPRTNAPLTGMDRIHEANVKRHFLESELKTADDLIVEYMEHGTGDMNHSASRQKLIWLLERLQEEVL